MNRKVFSVRWFSVQREADLGRAWDVARPSRLPACRENSRRDACSTPLKFAPFSSAFTLFEVLIALGVFAISVTGLAIALDSAVMAAFEARERALARVVLESRLSAVMSDPPLKGTRIIEARDNNGIRVEETMVKFEAQTTNGIPVTGLWKLTVSADWGRRDKSKETAEILFFKP